MKNRVGEMVGQVVEGMPWLGTFHAIGVKILRRHAELVGLKSDFTILDVDDQVRLIKQLAGSREYRREAMAGAHLRRHARRLEEPRAHARSGAGGRSRRLRQRPRHGALRRLSGAAEDLNAVDFGDLLLENIRLFREHPTSCAIISARFKYILVDEYQDTNVAQYLWLRLLGQSHATTTLPAQPAADDGKSVATRPVKNICCVGDDDQSIYGWRGAEVDNILRFEKDFPGANVIRLERNYRSHRPYPRRRLASHRA